MEDFSRNFLVSANTIYSHKLYPYKTYSIEISAVKIINHTICSINLINITIGINSKLKSSDWWNPSYCICKYL